MSRLGAQPRDDMGWGQAAGGPMRSAPQHLGPGIEPSDSFVHPFTYARIHLFNH